MFVVKVCTDFSAAHALRGYEGDCARVHGHNYKVEVLIKVVELDAIGITVDFKDIKAQTKNVIKKLDHQFINEIAPFNLVNPTAENLAKYFFDKLKPQFNNDIAALKSIKIWETDNASVSYYE